MPRFIKRRAAHKLIDHKDELLAYAVLRRWKRRGHEVALIRLTNKANSEVSDAHLMCECDFDCEDVVRDGRTVRIRKGDPHRCRIKKRVRDAVLRRTRKRNFARWRKMGLRRAVLDIKRRVDGGEWLGQHEPRMIYVQEVAKLLGRPAQDVWAACRELYAEEKLDLDGAILCDYAQGFRFPEEMVGIMRHVVEELLGWPNGDAGDFWIGKLEQDVQQKLGFESGKAAFGKQWPHIDGVLLAEHGLEPVAEALRAAASSFPAYPLSDELVGTMVGGWLARPRLVSTLATLQEAAPEISPVAFREFLAALLRLSFERVDVDRHLRVEKVTPERTLRDMADWLSQVAVNCRAQAKKG